MKRIYIFLILLLFVSRNVRSQNLPSYVPVSGLLGWWSLAGNALDSSANAYNGTNSGATPATDRYGNANGCLYFNSDYVEVLYLPLNFQSDFTFSYWQKLNSYNHARVIVDLNENAICNGTPHIWQYLDSVRLGMCGTAAGSMSMGGQANLLNNWINYTFTSGNGITNMYKNGVLYFTLNNIWPYTTSAQFTLANGGNTSAVLHGEPSDVYLDDVGIWTRVLTQQEITDLYNTTTGINQPETKNDITVFPSIDNNQIHVIINSKLIGSSYSIKDLAGKIIESGKLNTENSIIETGKMLQGSYVISVDNEFRSKFIVLKH